MNKTSVKQIEYKSYVGEMKATNDSQGIIEGYLNTIGNIDDGDDRTMGGAFKRTLTNAYARKNANSYQFLWPYLWNHDPDLIPPGGIFDGDETKHGLFTKVQFNLDMAMGRDLYSSFKMGTLRKQSMGYICHKSEYVKEAGKMIRNLLEVEILEGSAVVFPMNDLAEVTGVKRNGIYVPKYYQGFCSEKDKSMDKKPTQTEPPKPQKKDFNDEYRTRCIQDWMGSFYTLTSALSAAVMDSFDQGDDPMGDTQANLNGVDDSPGFIQQFLAWVQEGIDLDVSNYLDEMEQSPSEPCYGYMSNRRAFARKAGAMFSQANLDMLGQHMASLHEAGDQLHQMADDLAKNTGATTYDDSSGRDAEDGDNEKRNSRFRSALAAKGHSSPPRDTDERTEITGALARLTALAPKFN